MGTGTVVDWIVVDCRVSVGLVLGHLWTATYQQDWYWASSFLKCICSTGTEAVLYCIVLIRLVLWQ